MEFLIQSRSPLELTAAMQHASAGKDLTENMVNLADQWRQGGNGEVSFSETVEFEDELGKSTLTYTYAAVLTTTKEETPDD